MQANDELIKLCREAGYDGDIQIIGLNNITHIKGDEIETVGYFTDRNGQVSIIPKDNGR